MSMPYDSMLNTLIDEHLQDWSDFLAKQLGLPTGPAQVLDTDLATNLRADRLFRVQANPPFVIHLELESSWPADIPERLLRYNVLARYVSQFEVFSVVMLLRPKANSPELNGFAQWRSSHELGHIAFRYGVIRVWEQSFASMLSCPGLSPLALLTNEASQNLESASQTLFNTLRQEVTTQPLLKSLFHSAYILAGLRYPTERLAKLFEELTMTLEDSSTYRALRDLFLQRGLQQGLQQGINQGLQQGLQQGRIQGVQEVLLELGQIRFGPAEPSIVEAIQAIQDLDRLKRMQLALLSSTTWKQLLEIT
jgi:predicted transposase YdaD